LDNEDSTSNTEGQDSSKENLTRITIHAKQLPKGTYVRLRPLEAGYDPEDWKALLEQHLRTNFTTLTNGEILTVPGERYIAGKKEEFRFLIDKFAPDGEGICVVDTDLEVDIEALNEEQARETLKRRLEKTQRVPDRENASSTGGELEFWKAVEGQVLEGEVVDYELLSWDRSQGIEFELGGVSDELDLDVMASPFSSRQRARPREREHVFGNFSSHYPKRIRISPTNAELDDAESIYVSVSAYSRRKAKDITTNAPIHFYLHASPLEPSQAFSNGVDASQSDKSHGSDEAQCKNCHQWVPQRTMMLHENFCLRNNILCPQCSNVFKKTSSEWQNHWHCPHGDEAYGNTLSSKFKHDDIAHTPTLCDNCGYEASSILNLAQHRTTVCPGKIILCRFCHLLVPQEGDPSEPNPEALISGLTPHELADGARTTECHLCSKIVRLRDMSTHLKHHDLERVSRPAPRICRNINCGRTLHGVGKNGDIGAGTRMGQGPGNDLGLCSICYGPLYVAMYDPEGRALKRRVERRYLTQLLTGCGKTWCGNEFCRTGRKHLGTGSEGTVLTTKDILPMVKPWLDALSNTYSPLHFCVDEGSQKRRKLAEMMAGEGTYDLGWCVASCEAENGDLDKARGWLLNWAPKKSEVHQ
jgi:hypothetical protein